MDLSLGEKIMLLRKKRKVSQKELASALGINPSNLPNYESGRYKPSIEMLIKITDFFEISLDALLKNRETDDLLQINDQELIKIIKQIDLMSSSDKTVIKGLFNSYLENTKKNI